MSLKRLLKRPSETFHAGTTETETAQSQHWRGLQLKRQLKRNHVFNLKRSTHSLESGTVKRSNCKAKRGRRAR
jgi:hypothetical protein